MRRGRCWLFASVAFVLIGPAQAGEEKVASSAGAGAGAWVNDPEFFPIAVWLQNPSRAAEYRRAGINMYVGLWRGPTEEQLSELKRHGMRVICSQNEFALTQLDDPTIAGWMHGDEPDNAQPLRRGEGYGPPIPPAKILENYQRIKNADPSRPVLLNLGQGVAWDGWHGRGVRTNHPEDYPQYVQGADIASFDIYPAVHDHPDVAGKLWMVADGVTRLRKWTAGSKPVWNCIECTHISNPEAKATPQQVKAEVWMSLIRGSRGLIYFVHQFKPTFVEAALLADPEMLAQISSVNHQIQELAPVLNSPSLAGVAAVDSSSPDVPVEVMVKRHQGATYLFAVAMRGKATTATIRLSTNDNSKRVEVLGEDRELTIKEGTFRDSFAPWEVHLYRLTAE